jgi:allantoicase
VSEDDAPDNGWIELVPKTSLQGDAHNYIGVDNDQAWTHLRLNIFPDGGIARLRVYGEIRPTFSSTEGTVDLVALENGGRAIACSDEHYGSMHNLNVAGRGVNMGDGWETARRRGPGNDWVILALGHAGEIEKIEVDTAHFKGNYPDRVAIEAAMFANDAEAAAESVDWLPLLAETKLEMDKQHYFESELESIGVVSHVRLSIYPDGGLSRVRLHGRFDRDA